MPKVDWSKLLFRCSCLGLIMTEPKEKVTKDAGGLGKTCISHLIKIYGWEKYGRIDDIQTAAIKKGLAVEEDSITLISEVEKVMYKKNTERINNEYFTGLPDMFLGKEIRKAKIVKDAKSSWNLESFLKNEVEELSKLYYWQFQGYASLTGAKSGSIDFCLVNTPIQIINDEKKRLFYKLNVATEDNEDYKSACAELEFNSIFDDIPKKERIIKFPIQRNDEDIKRAQEKVESCRKWLADFDQKRMSR